MGIQGTQTEGEGGSGKEGDAKCPVRSIRLFMEDHNARMKKGRIRGTGGNIMVNYIKCFYTDMTVMEASQIYDDLTPQYQ